jgi:hypothetical protein
MSPKMINILYWVFTGLFGAFMLFSAIPNIIMDQQSITFITNLGYPEYIIPFLGWAKLIGVVIILIPGLPRLKEWAYAGLLIDLVGAVYSLIAKEGFKPDMMFMLLPFVLFTLSYMYYHKRRELKSA